MRRCGTWAKHAGVPLRRGRAVEGAGRLFSTPSSGACGPLRGRPRRRGPGHSGRPHPPARRSTAPPGTPRHLPSTSLSKVKGEGWGSGGSASRYARRAREPCAQTRTGRSPLLGRTASTRPPAVEGRKKARPATELTSPISVSFFPVLPSTAAVPSAPGPAFASGTATPYGHDRAAEQQTIWLVRAKLP
jgi:hypothetical protein